MGKKALEKKILFRTVLEVVGKPKEHVEASLKGYVNQLKENKRYAVVKEEFADVKEQEKSEFWMVFAEMEIWTENLKDLAYFCFDYMPSLIEIIKPGELEMSDIDITSFLNDLQAKLHGIDMIAKQLKLENDALKHNIAGLLKNYIMVLLTNRKLSSEQLHSLTGVEKDKLEDFLDKLIDQKVVDMEGNLYYLRKKEAKKEAQE
ncbi:MAG: hypothetical protein AB1668_03515 [Nanoarchaeota archaeon]